MSNLPKLNNQIIIEVAEKLIKESNEEIIKQVISQASINVSTCYPVTIYQCVSEICLMVKQGLDVASMSISEIQEHLITRLVGSK